MATIRPIQAQRGIDIGGIPDTRIDDSVGRGLQALGGALENAASVQSELDLRRERLAQQNEEFRTDQSFRRWNDNMSLEYAKIEQDIDPSGEGFTARVSGQLNTKAGEFLDTVPQSLRPKFTELVASAREEWLNKAAAAEIDQRNTWFRTGITETQEKLQTQVFNDPNLFSAALEDGYRAIDASGLPPTEKETLRKAWSDTLALTLGEREARDAEADPATAAGSASRLGVGGARGGAVDQFVDRIIGVESGGNANAKNPNSSATGLGQFIDSTWLSMIRKHRPDVAEGRSSQEILALRTDPALSREMTRAYAQENAQFLAAQGIEGTAGNIYLAHFLGPRGAAQVLKADPSTPIANVVGQDVVRANPFLKGKSASEVAQWASRKMGGAKGEGNSVPADPRYEGLSLTQRLEIYDGIQAAAQRGKTANDAKLKAAYDTAYGELDLGIETGEVSSRETILNSMLNAKDQAVLLRRLDEKNEEALATGEAMDLFGSGQLHVDAYSTQGRKTVDNVWNALAKTAPADQLLPSLQSLVEQTGVVPQPVINVMRRGLTSTNPSDVASVMQTAMGIRQADPAALGIRDGGSEVVKAADTFAHLTQTVGLSAEEAAQRIIDLRDPEKVRARSALLESKPIKDFIKNQATESNVRDIFDPGFGFDPQLGETPAQAASMIGEYRSILEESLFDSGGDKELGEELAAKRFQRLYGASSLTLAGDGVVTRLPPETIYPAGPDGTHDYVREQAIEALKTEGINASEVFLQSDEITDEDYRAGRPARYQVFYREEGGDLERFNLPFYAVPPSGAPDLGENRARRDQNRSELLAGRDREGNLGRFLEGDPLTGTILPRMTVRP